MADFFNRIGQKHSLKVVYSKRLRFTPYGYSPLKASSHVPGKGLNPGVFELTGNAVTR
jgi:hypothetical protein